jgi:DNA invertase Pin-like site-specific DNA recombinase
MVKPENNQQRAVAYFRTSSASNVGDEKDSLNRQQSTVDAFAVKQSYEVVAEFHDAAVSGSDAIEDRPGFCLFPDREKATCEEVEGG